MGITSPLRDNFLNLFASRINRMKILVFTSQIHHLGGAEKLAVELAEGLNTQPGVHSRQVKHSVAIWNRDLRDLLSICRCRGSGS